MFFGRRQGRAVKPYKQKLLEEKLPLIKLSVENESVVCATPFDHFKKAYLEIGFGEGTHLAHLAEKNPDTLIVGCEPFINGIGSCLAKVKAKKLLNVRIHDGPVQTILPYFAPAFFSKIFLLFPDPWPKKRHFKRRIVSADNMYQFFRFLEPGGGFVFASDHEGYREWALDVFHALEGIRIVGQGFEPPSEWVETYFQKKGLNAGRDSYFITLQKDFLKKIST